MKFFNRATTSGTDAAHLEPNVASIQEKANVLQRSIIALLHFLKTFAIDVKEIHVDRFKETLDELAERFKSQDKPKHTEVYFENKKELLLNFIERQHRYITDREKELRDIIDLLTRAMANFNVENRDFYQRVYDQGEKIIEITRLDDIRKIKNALKVEVDQMHEMVDQKRDLERRQMQQLAGQVDVLRQELERTRAKSMIDGLTGIYYRQAFDDYLLEKIERSDVMNDDFSLLMLDLDDFKAINDNFGHLIGDRVLVACAQKCRSSIRSDDFLARYGGEEFAIVLSGASLRNSLKKARQICTTIASARYATNEGQTDDYLSMTVSIGVSAYKKGDTADTLIARADKALYDAKRGGKNRAAARKT